MNKNIKQLFNQDILKQAAERFSIREDSLIVSKLRLWWGAQKQYRLESYLSKAFKTDVFLTYAPNMKITTGIIER